MHMQKILVFGQLTDIIGDTSLMIPYVTSCAELKENLFEKFPALNSKTFLIAVDNKIVKEDFLFQEGSVIALLPPFSGG
jgi:sulfur-carrier protein